MDPNAKKTALRMIPYGLFVLTAAKGARLARDFAQIDWAGGATGSAGQPVPQQLHAREVVILTRGDDVADDLCQLHISLRRPPRRRR